MLLFATAVVLLCGVEQGQCGIGEQQPCAASTAAEGTVALPSFEEWVLGGGDAAAFFAAEWQAKPLLLRNLARRPHVDFSDIKAAMAAAREQGKLDGKMAKGGRSVLRGAELTPKRVTRAFKDGASLTVGTAVGLLNPAIARAARAVEMATGINCEVNVYWSNASATSDAGFRPHWDSQDVFVLQLQGTKAWQVFGHGEQQLPFDADKPADWQATVPPAFGGLPSLDVTLNTGDVLYVPRGFLHYVKPRPGEASLHVSLTVLTEGFTFSHALRFAVDPARGVAPEATQLPATVERFGRPLMESVVPGSQLSRAALFGALLDYLERTDVDFRKAALPVSATTAEHVELLGRRWVESVSSPAAQQVLQRAGAQCGEQCTAGLQEVLREIIAASTANGPKRLLQELELRYFQGNQHFGAPRAPSSCLQPVRGGALTMDTLLHRNQVQHSPARFGRVWQHHSACIIPNHRSCRHRRTSAAFAAGARH